MSHLSQKEGEKILQPYFDFFVGTYRKAFEDWKKVSTIFPTCTPRTRASFINDRVREYTRIEFPSDQIIESGGRFLLHIDKLAGRYKKLRNSLPQNIPTQMVLKLENQQLELGEELAPLTLVNIGYVPDKAHSGFKFMISCAKNRSILWQISILTESDEIKPVDIPESDIQKQVAKQKRVHKKAQNQ